MLSGNSLQPKDFCVTLARVAGRGKRIKLERQTVQIQKRVAAALKEWTETRSKVTVSMNDAASAFIEWCLRQPRIMQTAMLDGIDEGMEPHYAAALRKLADEIEKGVEVPPTELRGSVVTELRTPQR